MNTDSFMAQSPVTYINEFLHRRGLGGPDGRALYAYRCTTIEFDSLAEALSHSAPAGTTNAATRAFVLYAAEWWQRQYDGHHWAWEPLLASIKWHVHYPDLYEPVRAALSWWRIDLVRLPTSIRYLGTFACQGGLPLGLVGDADSRVVQYLRAVLNHTAEYRKFVDDAIDLARDQQHLLRPPTLRRDYVFRLAADLIEAVLDLQSDAQGEDPISTLDQVRPGWRKTMPLALENERARDLLTGLLRVQVRPPTDDFRVERFLRRTSVGWRLGARVRLPASISAEHLAHHLNMSEGDLPPRLQVRVHGDRVRDVGLYAAQSDHFLLVARDMQSQTELWDTEAAAEVRLQFLSGDVVGEGVVPYRGTALGELPWAFRGDANECPFIGEGSVSNRAPEIVVLAPDGCFIDHVSTLEESSARESERLDPSTGDNIRVLSRVLWRIAEPTAIKAVHGRCVVRPSSGQAVEEDYRLEGQRCYDLESAWPLFCGTPRLRISKAEQAPRAVPTNEVNWRQTGGEWQQRPNAFGLWEVRHMSGGELRYLGRVGILPEQFCLSLAPGSDMSEGYLVLNGAEAVKVSGHSQESVVTPRIEGDVVWVHVAARNAAAPTARMHLRLHWQGAAGLVVQAPFPGRGGHFLRDDKPLDRELAVDDLYGVRATALSPDGSQKFWIQGELKALDLDGSLLRVAHFRLPLRKSGVTHELPLIDLRPMIQLLLASSSSGEASVALRIVDEFQYEHGAVRVNRFAAALKYDPNMAFVAALRTPDDNKPTATFEALPIARPDTDPVPLDVISPADTPHGAVLPQDLNINEPWLVVARHDDRVRVRPVVIGGRSSESVDLSTSDAEAPRLCEAVSLRDWNSRIRAINAAMDAMLEAEDVHRVEEEWDFLTDVLLRAEGLPATSLNLLKVLVEKPNLLVQCMFRLDSAPRQLLWRLEDELPFSWLLIQREVWWTEARQAFERLRDPLAGVSDGDQMACDHLTSILSEAIDRFRGLYTVACDIGFRLMGGKVPDLIVEEAQKKRDDKTQEQLNLRYSMADWPTGDGRSEWAEELDQGELLNKLAIWQQEGELRERQPIFDTPVAAAWCCFHSKPTDRTTFLVKRIRTHDPEWFDLAYEAAWFRFAFMQDTSNI